MFKKPFSFSGRIRRTEYGLSVLIYSAVVGAMAGLSLAMGQENVTITGLIALVVYLPLVWFLLAQGAKRCHDRNNTGFFQLIPFYGFWMLFADGDIGPNDFGEDPKQREKMQLVIQ